jgi:hypothetical protein
MPNFDFHSNLSPIQFERLIRDILEIKFKGISFRTYSQGKDKGIDIKSIDSPKRIICQTKLYQNRFPQLLASLKQEAKKIKKHKIARYIIATSCSLTNDNIQEIINIFKVDKISIQECDVWDRELLNQFLTQSIYKSVLKTHLNLFLTDITIIEESLKGVINNNILQRSIWELHNIRDEAKYFIETNTSKNALQQILAEKIIILTGTAGCGKTTTAKIIINCLLNLLPDSKEFIKLRSINEAEDIYDSDKQQIFLFDDYWGQFTEEVHEHHAGNRTALPDFIKRIRKSKLHYIIITSRDYIIENESIQKQQALKDLIDNHRLIIEVSEFDPQERAHIFIRHLYHSNCSRDFLSHLYTADTLDEIVTHRNYNPRLICEYIHKRFDEITIDSDRKDNYSFYFNLERHLDYPNLYWHNLIKAQNDSARLLLFIIVISSSNNTQEEIRATFDRCVETCRNKGFDVSVKNFREAERLLEDGFIELSPIAQMGSWRISFKNGSIGDAVLQYLKEEATEWIPILLQGAVFFDQLVQNFVTFASDKKTNKIILQNKDKSILIKRILGEIWTLHEDVTDLMTPHFKSPIFMERLSKVTRIFDLQVDLEIREFLTKKGNIIVELIANEPGFPFDRDNTFHLSSFFKNLKPWINFNVPLFLEKVFYSINYFEDYEQFLKFQSIYPAEFERFLLSNKKKIKEQVHEVIIDTTEMTDEDDLDILFDFTYYEILKGFKLRHSKYIEEELEYIGVKYFKNVYKRVKRKKTFRRKKTTNEFWKNYNKRTKPYLKLLNQYIAQYDSINDDLLTRTLLEMEVLHQKTLDQLCCNPSIKRNEALVFLKTLAIDSYHSRKWYTERELAKLLESHSEAKNIVNLDIPPVFQQQEKWFTLCSSYSYFLVSLHCKENISNTDYYDKIMDILHEISPDDVNLIQWITETDSKRFKKLFLIPLVKDFLSQIDFTDQKSKILSCCNKTQWTVDLSFEKRKGKIIYIETEGGGSSDTHHLEIITKFLGIEEQFGFYGDEIVSKINELKTKEPEIFNVFVSHCLKNIVPERKTHPFIKDEYMEYCLDLPKELINPEFFKIAEASGWVSKLSNIIDRLRDYIYSEIEL